MWLFLPTGFYSIVAKNDNPELLVVRSREREHIERFAERVAAVRGEPCRWLENAGTDYAYRLTASRYELDVIMSAFLRDELTYDNYKGAAADQGFGDVGKLHRIWSFMRGR